MDQFYGSHSEWNLGSPGGWDYQRTTQIIAKEVWKVLMDKRPLDLALDFDHPLLHPVFNLVELLLSAHRRLEGNNPGVIAVVAEEETLKDVVENRNLAQFLDAVDGIHGALMAPHELELENGRVCYRGEPVSVMFMDFNTDVLLNLHRKQGLAPALQAVREGRVINPRGTEPINSKSVFEVLTDEAYAGVFHEEVTSRTPWTRRFKPRKTTGPRGEAIDDLPEWTRKNWDNLVLKPERGYSGKGVSVGGVNSNVDDIVEGALRQGDYIVQEKVAIPLWSETLPEPDPETKTVQRVVCQTDFRCLFGSTGLYGFLGRYGSIPTNVGSGGGVHPLAVLKSEVSIQDATRMMNDIIEGMDYDDVEEALTLQKNMALEREFTYLLGPIRIAMRPRLITLGQMESLKSYCAAIWKDCLTLEKMWKDGELSHIVDVEPDELDIIQSQPWGGSPAIFAADGLFSFGAHIK